MTRRDKRRLLASAILSLAILGVALWQIGSTSNSTSSDSTLVGVSTDTAAARHTGNSGGLHVRAVDPAGAPMEWIREGFDLTPPDHAPPLHQQLQSGEDFEELMGLLEWSLPLGQGGEVGLEMARCAARFEPQLDDVCSWEITAVLRRNDDETGSIDYARATVTTGSDQAACRAFASCSSKAWSHRETAPMPDRLGDELAFSQIGRGSFWHAGLGTNAIDDYRSRTSRVRRSHDELDAEAHAPTQVAAASLGWNLIFFQHRIDEFECMVELLEGREEACRT